MPLRFTTAMPRFEGDPGAWRDAVRRVEDLGFHAVCISDHLSNGWVMEPVVAMTSALEVTSTLRVHSLVLSNDFRHPVLLHKAMATLDAFSGGRVGIGLGAGWMPSDYVETGITLEQPGTRVARLAESVQVLRALFGDGPATFAGEHYRLDALDGQPKPVQPGGPPILVGGGSRAVVEVAGRYPDTVGVNPRLGGARPTDSAVEDLTRDRFARLVGWTRAAAEQAGRAADAVEVQVSLQSLRLSDVPGAIPWTSSLAQGADPAFTSPTVLSGPVGACAEQLIADQELLGIAEVHVGGDPVTAAALVEAVNRQW